MVLDASPSQSAQKDVSSDGMDFNDLSWYCDLIPEVPFDVRSRKSPQSANKGRGNTALTTSKVALASNVMDTLSFSSGICELVNLMSQFFLLFL
jgi:hypothetical protein